MRPSLPSKSTIQNTFVIEMGAHGGITGDVCPSIQRGKVTISYFVRVILDIPNARDIFVDIPITMLANVAREHRALPDPLQRLGLLDPDVSKWSVEDCIAWLQSKGLQVDKLTRSSATPPSPYTYTQSEREIP